MTAAFRILQEITTGYSIFEKDQVLTESQLNSITNYLNDRDRLQVIYLIGVGIVSGLRVSLTGDRIKVTKGVGITTDGDLLYYSTDATFDRFLASDSSQLKYNPFSVGDNREREIPVYELIRQDATDSGITFTSLSEFTATTTKELKNMVAVFLMETYVNDPDICTGTDCDNLGQDCINTPRLLLVDKDAVNLLLKPVETPDAAYNALDEIAVDRPLIPSSINSASDLAKIYRDVCTNIHNKLLAELRKLYPKCSTFLTDVFSSDPTGGWITRLTDIQSSARSDVGIQYYYDFLKDAVETYNEFRDLLFGDRTWCCPDITYFPKHLLLGNVVLNSGSDPDDNRTPFYPSPAVSQTVKSLNHAKFLARKIDTLIQTFAIPAISTAADSIRITPSLFEDKSVEERAIPYYYQVDLEQPNPIHKNWNYHLSQRRMEKHNYGYNATAYKAEGGAANPLVSQIGKFSFFRIEGYLGQKLGTVVSNISRIVKSHNLPFSMLVAKLGQSTQPEETDFGDLISDHSGIEHFGGVVRGGTFVLLADANNETVIADFMLPYYLSPPRNNIVAADGLESQRDRLVKIGYQTVFGSASGHSARQASLCLRDFGYYLDAIIESCRQDSTSYLDQFISNVKEMNKSLGYSNNWFITFYQAVKSNHGLTGEAAKVANSYLDSAISGLYSYNIEAADALNSKRDQLVRSGYQAVFASSPRHNPRQTAACLRDLNYYLDAIIESCRRDSTSYLDEFISGLEEINKSLGYPNSWFVTFYQAIKNNHGLTGEVAKVTNSYLDRAINTLG